MKHKNCQHRDILLGLMMYLLLLPEFILFVTVGTENILKYLVGVASFFVFSISLYTAVPLLVERRYPVESGKESSFRSGCLAVAIALTVILLKMFLQKQQTPKFISEYSSFIQTSGLIGVIGATLQHLYYFAEMVLCCYMLRVFQKAVERMFGNKYIPYGVAPNVYVTFQETATQYDTDGNGSYTQAEAKAAIDAQFSHLTTAQKAVLWQWVCYSSGSKKNPYDPTVGQNFIDSRDAAKAAAEE